MQILTLILAILVCSANVFAQAPEIFDISSFRAPKGWNVEVGQDAIQFSTAETKRDGTFSFWRNGEAQRTYQYQLVDARGNLIQ